MPEPKPIRAHTFPRAADEWYVEEPRATEFLLQRERFEGLTLDPCCGQGNIVSGLLDAGVPAIGTDLRNRAKGARWFKGTSDFLTSTIPPEVRNIVMNPPFAGGVLAEAFIRRALTYPLDKLAVFVEARFVFSAGRAQNLYRDLPPEIIYPVFPRISCPPGEYLLAGGKAEGGKADHVWIIWTPGAPAEPTRVAWAR